MRTAKTAVKADASFSVKESLLPAEQQRKYDYFFLEAMRMKEKNEYDAAFGLLQHCLDINPNALTAGKMFGNGTYFANKAKKSMRYTDLPGQNNVHATSGETAYLSVFKVVYKNAMDIYHWQNEYTRLNYRALNVKGYDAVFAHGGVDLVNDEIIVSELPERTALYY